jgi:glycine betaine/proline transport system substrate-binding protein
MKKIISLLSALIISAVSFAGISNAADSKKPIVIPTHNWSSQVVMAYVIGGIFESMGNNVKYVPADSQAVYESIRIGDVTISHEVWESAFGKSFTTALEKGGILDWGDHEARTLEDMGYPNWVADKGLCPGLPDWTALKNPDCAKNFVQKTLASLHVEVPNDNYEPDRTVKVRYVSAGKPQFENDSLQSVLSQIEIEMRLANEEKKNSRM